MNNLFSDHESKLKVWLGIAIGAAIISTLAFFTLLLYMLYGGNAVLKLG